MLVWSQKLSVGVRRTWKSKVCSARKQIRKYKYILWWYIIFQCTESVTVPMETQHSVVVLDRCANCVTTKRSAQYCRVVVSHTAPRAQPCQECQLSQLSVAECRVRQQHKGPSAEIKHVDDLAAHGLPQCCTQLTTLTISQHQNQPLMYTGYMRDYNQTKWAKWLESFALQTNFKFVANRGELSRGGTAKSGLLKIDGIMERY